MSRFSFNFNPKRDNDIKGFRDKDNNKENEFTQRLCPQSSMRSQSSVGPKQSTFGMSYGTNFGTTPTQRSVFFNKTNDSAKTQEFLDKMSNKSKRTEVLTIDSTVQQISEDSNILKHKIAAELERIETFKTMTQMEIKRQSQEIISLKTNNEDLEMTLVSVRKQNSELTVKLKVEASERQDVLTKMNNTRDMFVKVTNYVQHIENRLESMDAIKDTFDMVNDKRCQQMKELNDLFTELSFKHKNTIERYESQITQKNTEWNILSVELDRKALDLEVTKSEANKRFESFVKELEKYKEVNHSYESSLIQEMNKNKDLTQKLVELEERYQSVVTNGQKKDQDLEDLRQDSEMKKKQMENQIQSLSTKEKDLIKIIDELKAELKTETALVESIQQKNLDLKAEKDRINADLDKKIKENEEAMTNAMNDNSKLIELNNELNLKVLSIETERQEFETSFQSEKHSVVSDFENTIKEMETNIESLREEKNQLIQWKEDKLTLIEELESMANKSMVEKETIEEKLNNDLKVLRDDFDNRMKEFSTKIEGFQKKIDELNALKEENETTIIEMQSESEVLRTEIEECKQKREKAERTLETQITNMNAIIQSSKSDFNNRLREREDRIREYRQEHERMRINTDHLTKKCERLENEKQSINRQLQELTINAMRVTTASPNRVLTPKFMSPIESTRISSLRTSSPIVKPLNFSQEIGVEDNAILSAKQELEQNFRRRSSQSSQLSLKKVAPVLAKLKDIKPKSKIDSKQMAAKGKQVKTVSKLNDSNSSESIYEIIEEKLKNKRQTKGVRKQVQGSKHRIESPVKVNMSLVDDKQKSLDTDTEEYDIEKTDKYLSPKKKMKMNVKTYGKPGVRQQNIIKGRPTPTKEDDLSWLPF